MEIDDFDYHVPSELIAQFPVPERDTARLLVLHRDSGHIEHTLFSHIHQKFRAGDVLVVNDTKVRPARLFGRKESGGRVEVLLLNPVNTPPDSSPVRIWEALIRSSKKPQIGSRLEFGPDFQARVISGKGEGLWDVELECEKDLDEVLEQYGTTPLPPYIKRASRDHDPKDRETYQTIFARPVGSVAAPTAGLHFTERLIERLRQKGVAVVTITLHVGRGTFQPVRVRTIERHRMHSEYFEVAPEAAERVLQAHGSGNRVIAVGSTSVRTIETLKCRQGTLHGFTDLFIYPGFRFRVTDGMVTNFHLPRSTLLMLVAAFAGKDLILRSYQEAIAASYRFYSYGDAMLIL